MDNFIKLKFTAEELQIINSALIQLPYKAVAALISNINIQLRDLEPVKNDNTPAVE